MEDKLLELKNMINNVIVSSGKGQITGQGLNIVLNEMVDVLSTINNDKSKALIIDSISIDSDGETTIISCSSEAMKHNKEIYEKMKETPFQLSLDITSLIKSLIEALIESNLGGEIPPEATILFEVIFGIFNSVQVNSIGNIVSKTITYSDIDVLSEIYPYIDFEKYIGKTAYITTVFLYLIILPLPMEILLFDDGNVVIDVSSLGDILP